MTEEQQRQGDIEDYVHGGSSHEWRDEVEPFTVPVAELGIDRAGNSDAAEVLAELRKIQRYLNGQWWALIVLFVCQLVLGAGLVAERMHW